MDSNPFVVIIALLFCGCFQSVLSECDSICGCGYQFTVFDVDGPGKEFTSPGKGIENCAQECSNRPGCTSFEYNHDGDEDYKCGTYTGGRDNMNDVRTGDDLNWQTCVAIQTFTVLSVDHKEKGSGNYFNFRISDVDEILGHTEWDNEVFMIHNSRLDDPIKVILWRNANGGSRGDGHGRREPNPSASDWKTGDELSFIDDASWSADSSYDHSIGKEAFYYAWGAYCDKDIIESWDNGLGAGPAEVKQFELHRVINTPDGALQAYIGYDGANGRILMSFRGSTNWKNWITNIEIPPTAYPYAAGVEGAKLHAGFYDAFKDLGRAGLTYAIRHMALEYPGFDWLSTGHSLGGALASIAALDLKINPAHDFLNIGNVDVITFGMPRVFSPSLAGLFNDVIRTSWRIVNRYDIVATIPIKMNGYKHFGTQIWYRWQRWRWNRTPTGFVVCDGSGEDRSCFGTDFWKDRLPIPWHHTNYFDYDSKAMCKATRRRRLIGSRLLE